jgi:hypothetical protein
MLMIWEIMEFVEPALLLLILGIDIYIFTAYSKKIKSLEDNIKRLSTSQRILDNHMINIETRVNELEEGEE